MKANKVLRLPFEYDQQLITAHYGNGEKHQIIVPPQLQLNQGMFLPDHIVEQEEFRPNYGLKPKDLIAFNYAKAEYNKGIISDKCVHFYLYDYMFQCINNHPLRYTAMLMSYPMVISPDNSVYMNWSEHERRQSAWRNQQMTRLWQANGMPVIFNVSWAGPDSYSYCIHVYPKHCVIAINCSGIRGNPDAVYFWHLGYEEVIKALEPSLIVRYGDKMEGEYEAISIYFNNFILNRLHYGR
jgi:hypothetical protein